MSDLRRGNVGWTSVQQQTLPLLKKSTLNIQNINFSNSRMGK